MGASPGEHGAAPLLLTLEDLPPGPWLELPSELGTSGGQPVGGGGEALLTACLGDDFPEAAVTDVADSPRFVRPEAAMAFSSAFVFADAATAAFAATRVGAPAFAEAFAQAVAAGSRESAGGAQVLDVTVEGVACDVDDVAVVHRATITGGDHLGLVPIHVELAVLNARASLVLVWLADTPHPFSSVDREHVLAAVAGRLMG
ncbi:MAG: hypothetical protein ACR2H3_06615 [Acidimicrobiales bacterium]